MGIGLAVLALGGPGADAGHGGAVRLSAVPVGPYAVSAWTRPTPPVAGATTVDVAVMRPADRTPVTGATVRLTARPLDHAARAMSTEASVTADPLGVRHRGDLAFPTAGRWEVTVAARGQDGEGSAVFLLDVERASSWTGVAVAVAAAVAGGAALFVAWRRRAAAVGALALLGAAGVGASPFRRATPGRGESFPNAPQQTGDSGPALTGMGRTTRPSTWPSRSSIPMP